jgi:hypothetical protein
VRGWTEAYRRWLTAVRFDHPAQQIVLQDYIHAVEDAEVQSLACPNRMECLVVAGAVEKGRVAGLPEPWFCRGGIDRDGVWR